MDLALQGMHPLGPIRLLDAIVGVGPMSSEAPFGLGVCGAQVCLRKAADTSYPAFLLFHSRYNRPDIMRT